MNRHMEALAALDNDELEILADVMAISVDRLRAIRDGAETTFTEDMILGAFR